MTLPSSFLLSFNQIVAASTFTLGYLVCRIINNPALSIAYGVSIFVEQISLVIIANAIEEAIAITAGKFYGANNPEKAKNWLTNAVTTMVFINVVLISAFLLYGKQAMILVGFDPELAANVYWVLSLKIPSVVLLEFNSGLLSYLLSVETNIEYISLAPISILINSALTLALAYWTKLGFWSVIIGLTAIQLTDMLIYLWVYFTKMDPKYRGLGNFRQSFSTLCDFLREFAVFWLGFFGEFIGSEIMVYLSVLTKDNDQIAAVTYVVNVAYFMLEVGTGQSYVSRAVTSALIGANKMEAARKFAAIYLIGLLLIGCIFGCCIYFCAGILASIYTQPGTTMRTITTNLIRLYSFWVPQDILFFSMLTISRTIGLAYLSIALNFFFVLFCQPMISIWLRNQGRLTCFTVLATTYSMYTICFVILAIAFYGKNWQKIDSTEEDKAASQILLTN